MFEKWNAQDLLDTLNKEVNSNELHELWKALIAFECGATEIDNQALEKTLDYFYDNDYLTSIINNDLLIEYQENLEKNKKSIDN